MFKIKEYEDRMKKSVSALETEYQNIRAGRANPKLVETITFSYYGTDTPINQAATIQVPEARMITITPWDVKNIKPIEQAILASDLGITPSNDGKMIRLPFPPLTEERRKDLVKNVHALKEDAKVAVRNIRRDAMDKIKSLEKAKEFTEDDRRSSEDDVQKLTDKYIGELDKTAKHKESELMEI